ncbi:MAG: glycoside hydrolase family 88 protein [Bacteroidales bacterium]|nr:glycoside hydrolase family 88 protein [Bacteroidales bacterium]
MMRALILALSAVLAVACTAGEPLSEAMVRSEMQRNPEASYIDGLGGKLKWNYTTGLELKAFLDVYQTSGQASVLSYVDAWYDAIIADDGTIGVNYKKSNYSTDHICPGNTLFQLYDLTGKEKYRLAMDRLFEQVLEQPRTPEGGFWHKQVYPQQMWLDGLYMAQPFYAQYTARYAPDSLKAVCFADIARHFIIVAEHTFDPATGLYRHAWDSSHEMFWCNPETGQSDHAWGRALGWYAMALVEVLPFLPGDTPGRGEMLDILRGIVAKLPDYADPATGMWYQVLDRPGAEGNYVEATCSAMFVYSMLKGCRLGYLDCLPYAKASYGKMLDAFVTREDGLVSLNRCCEVAGLGGKEMRRGDYTYYINEKIRSNDPKGIGPLIWAALEYEKL